MKKIIKALLLSAVILGSAVGCQETNSSTSTSSNPSSSDTSSISESRTSSSPFSSDTSSSISSSSSSSVAPTLAGITLDTANVKKSYEQGESLDLTGLVVTANYSDNTSEAVTNYTTNPANGAKLDTVGAIPVTVAYKTATASFNVIVARPSKKAWTEAEAKIMSDHLYGYVLPFTGSEDAAVSYDSESDLVEIQGGPATSAVLTAYAEKIVADNFTRVNSTNYVYEKSLTTDAGLRHIRVGFGNRDGSFYLQAYDPYYYAFPTAFAEYVAKEAFDSKTVPASIDADYYEVSDSDFGIYCYTSNANAVDAYSTALETATWKVEAELDQGYKTAISPDGKYCVKYAYNSQYGSLDIFMGPLSYWNTKVVEDFYNKYNGYVVDIPAFNVEKGEYIFKESNVNEAAYASEIYEAIHAFMYIYGADASALPSYETTLKDNNWEVYNNDGFYKAYLTIPNQGTARLEFEYSSKYSAIIVTIYYKLDPIILTEWPEAEVNEVLGDIVLGSLPKYTGAKRGFSFLNDMFGTAVVIHVEKGNEQATMDYYIDTDLKNAGYVKDQYGNYSAPDSEISINPMIPGSGMVTIEFSKTGYLKTFPASAVNMYLKGNDTVPAYTSDTYVQRTFSYDIVSEDTIALYCHFEQGVSEHGRLAYEEILTTAGYTRSNNTFVSPNRNFYINLSSTGDYKQLIINVRGTPKSAFESLWPSTKIAQLFFAEGYTDPLPSYDKMCDDITAGKNYDGSLFVLIETNDKSTVKTEYCGLLANANFTYDYVNSNDYDDVYKSPNNQYSATVSTNSLGVSIIIKPLGGGQQGGDTFPAETIYEYFPTAEGVLPILEDANASFTGEYDDYYKSYSVKITFATEALATTAYNTYVSQLKTANFRERIVWNGYAYIYYSPDNSFIVWVNHNYLKDGEIYIDIYPGNTSYFPAEQRNIR